MTCQADIANHLANGEATSDELAARTGIDGDKLARYLRNLCNSLIYQETAPNTFANNALSVTFRSEAKKALVGHWFVSSSLQTDPSESDIPLPVRTKLEYLPAKPGRL